MRMTQAMIQRYIYWRTIEDARSREGDGGLISHGNGTQFIGVNGAR